MTEADEQELFARLERLERSNWRWKVLATVLGVFFLLVASLGVLVVIERHAGSVQLRMAIEEEQRARMVAEQSATGRGGTTTRRAVRDSAMPAPKRMPRAPDSDEAP